jgi:tetratricopeptide (TPR) repeat protein
MSVSDPRAAASLTLIVLFAFVLVVIRRRFPFATLLALAYVVCLAPVIGIVPIPIEMADRYQYVPSVFACMLVAFLWARLHDTYRHPATLHAGSIVACQFMLTVQRTFVWSSNIAHLAETAEQTDQRKYPVVLLNLGAALAEDGRVEQARSYFYQVIDLAGRSPVTATAHADLAILYLSEGRLEEAHRHALVASDMWPERTWVHEVLANVCQSMGNPLGAAQALGRAIEVFPRSPDLRIRYAVSLYRGGRNDVAAAVLRGVLDDTADGCARLSTHLRGEIQAHRMEPSEIRPLVGPLCPSLP